MKRLFPSDSQREFSELMKRTQDLIDELNKCVSCGAPSKKEFCEFCLNEE